MKLKDFNGLYLFKRAFIATHREIVASLSMLIVITILFTCVMWVAEHSVNNEYSFVDALVWVVVKYVEDPADVTTAPVTLLGKYVGTMVGILGIAIFAVPAGLVGSGLLDAMAEVKNEETRQKNSLLLHKRFRRIAQAASWFYNAKKLKITYKFVPRYRSLAHILVKTGMTENEIIEAVNNCPDMRLMNMASTQSSEEIPQDQLVVVNFPLNKEYGCCVNRHSDVTIVAPAAVSELGTGNFAFSLAAMGGFNYVSKEITPNPDDPFGFYTLQKSKLKLIGDQHMKKEVESQAIHFIDDLLQLKKYSNSQGRKHWFFFILGTTKSSLCQVHFWRLSSNLEKKLTSYNVNGTEYGNTILPEHEETWLKIYQTAKEKLEKHEVSVRGKKQPISVDKDNQQLLKSVGRSNIMCRIGGGIDCNAMTIRMGYEVLIHNNHHLLMVKDLADAIKNQVEPEREIPEEARKCFLNEGDGYADDFCQTEVFEQHPEKLKKMIEKASKATLKQFGAFDLDDYLL